MNQGSRAPKSGTAAEEQRPGLTSAEFDAVKTISDLHKLILVHGPYRRPLFIYEIEDNYGAAFSMAGVLSTATGISITRVRNKLRSIIQDQYNLRHLCSLGSLVLDNSFFSHATKGTRSIRLSLLVLDPTNIPIHHTMTPDVIIKFNQDFVPLWDVEFSGLSPEQK